MRSSLVYALRDQKPFLLGGEHPTPLLTAPLTPTKSTNYEFAVQFLQATLIFAFCTISNQVYTIFLTL
jgi:hypothetical protein